MSTLVIPDRPEVLRLGAVVLSSQLRRTEALSVNQKAPRALLPVLRALRSGRVEEVEAARLDLSPELVAVLDAALELARKSVA